MNSSIKVALYRKKRYIKKDYYLKDKKKDNKK